MRVIERGLVGALVRGATGRPRPARHRPERAGPAAFSLARDDRRAGHRWDQELSLGTLAGLLAAAAGGWDAAPTPTRVSASEG